MGFTKSLGFGFVAAVLLLLPNVSVGQENTETPNTVITASTLLNSGFEIVATNYLAQSIVLTLQRSNRAFLCELNFDGTSVQCVEIK